MTGPESPLPDEDAARPMVAMNSSNRAPWIFGGVLALSAIALFSALEARRTDLTSPAISVPSGVTGGRSAALPELAVPQGQDDFSVDGPLSGADIARLARPEPQPAWPAEPPLRLARSNAPTIAEVPAPAALPPRPWPNPPVVLRRPPEPPMAAARQDPDRSYATRFANPATTVPKGTVIHAVLETALDSNRAGFARAIVSRDVRSFDGTRLLVPKGSRLLGQYEADVNHGQNRALIQWNRMTLPDGTIIDVDSPSADSLGRAGVKGKVNSHFFARFSGAILQSALDIGVQLATRKAVGDTVILGVPYRNQEKIEPQNDIKPTLTIKQGSSVSVFVARDLDFTDVVP